MWTGKMDHRGDWEDLCIGLLWLMAGRELGFGDLTWLSLMAAGRAVAQANGEQRGPCFEMFND